MPLLGSFSKLSIYIFQILIAPHYLFLNYRTTFIILMVLYSFLIGVYSLQLFVDCYFFFLVIRKAGQIPQNFFANICGVLEQSSVSYFLYAMVNFYFFFIQEKSNAFSITFSSTYVKVICIFSSPVCNMNTLLSLLFFLRGLALCIIFISFLF